MRSPSAVALGFFVAALAIVPVARVLAGAPAAAPAPTAPAAPAAAPAPAAPAAAPAAAAPAADAPVLPEPKGIKAGGQKVPAAPKGKTAWSVDTAGTAVSFVIVSNSAGPITGKLADASTGAYDAKKKKGVVLVDLTKLVTTNKDGAGNPLRDSNVTEAFFGARPFANDALKGAVTDAWKNLKSKIKNGVGTAALVIDSVDGDAANVADGATAAGTITGHLVLWQSVAVPLSFPVTATRAGDVVTVKSSAPAAFNIEAATGSVLRKALFETLLAAGCAHQAGIQSDVSISLDQVTLRGPKA